MVWHCQYPKCSFEYGGGDYHCCHCLNQRCHMAIKDNSYGGDVVQSKSLGSGKQHMLCSYQRSCEPICGAPSVVLCTDRPPFAILRQTRMQPRGLTRIAESHDTDRFWPPRARRSTDSMTSTYATDIDCSTRGTDMASSLCVSSAPRCRLGVLPSPCGCVSKPGS